MTDTPTQAPSVEQRLRAMADIRIFNATTFREAREIMRLAADELAERTPSPALREAADARRYRYIREPGTELLVESYSLDALDKEVDAAIERDAQRLAEGK